MPQVTVYVRNEDLEQWKSLGAKSTFIHNALRIVREGGLEALGLIVDDRTQVTTINEPLRRMESSSKVEQVPVKNKVAGSTPASPATCKNGHPIPEGRDKCLGKGCKYS